MSGGTGSTLVLRPEGLTAIAFDLDADNMAAGSYVVNVDTLRFREAEREIVEYAQQVGAEGGDVVGVQNPLVELSFEVVVVDNSRAGTMAMAHDLRVALQAGGYLEFKPEDLPGGVTSSYYAYLRGGPGGLKAKARNRWDRAPKTEGAVELYFTEHLVSLMTFPLLLSDPDSPITAVAATTVENRDDATGDNYVTIPAATLNGDSRALLQITMRNLETGEYDDVFGVYVFPRIFGLSGYRIVFEPGTIVVGSTEWATLGDATRSGGGYQRLIPSADDVVYRLQFQVNNWENFVGRHLLMIACRDNGGGEGDFEVRGGWSLGTGELKDPTPWKYTRGEWFGEWQLFSLGELEFPGTQMVDVEEANTIPYYELEVFRNSGGSGTFDLDFFIAAPVDLRPLYVDCSEVSFLNDHRLLLSNLEYPTQVAHIVDQSTYALHGPVKPLGLLPLANCGREATNGYRLYFFWERRGGTLVVDDSFAGYDANWDEIDDCDTGWGASNAHLDRVEGSFSRQVGAGAASHTKGHVADYSGWGDDDYFISIAKHDFNITRDEFRAGAAIDYFHEQLPVGAVWFPHIVRKGDFNTSGAPNWANIDQIRVYVLTGTYRYWDNWRWSALDPGATQPNDFGNAWDYRPSGYPWFVYTDASTRCAGNPVPVGVYGSGGDTEQNLVANMVNRRNIKMKARCYNFQSSLVTDGEIGLIFRMSNQGSGVEECYALLMDEDDDELRLYRYVAGTPTLLVSVGFTVDPATWYWLGVECYESTITCYGHTNESNLWDAPLFETIDMVHSAGKCGFMVKDGMGRFDDVEVWAEGDRYDPQDTMQVEVKALLRSVHPHCE